MGKQKDEVEAGIRFQTGPLRWFFHLLVEKDTELTSLGIKDDFLGVNRARA
jgi:hypothetical protein